MAWTGQSFSVGQVLTAAQMNNLQADITALANGDAGAPKIKNSALDTASINESNIDWANSKGVSVFSIFFEKVTASVSSFTTVTEFNLPIIVPANATTLTYRIEMKAGTTNATLNVRMNTSSQTGTTISTQSNAYSSFTGTVSLAGSSTPESISLERFSSAGTIDFRMITLEFS